MSQNFTNTETYKDWINQKASNYNYLKKYLYNVSSFWKKYQDLSFSLKNEDFLIISETRTHYIAFHFDMMPLNSDFHNLNNLMLLSLSNLVDYTIPKTTSNDIQTYKELINNHQLFVLQKDKTLYLINTSIIYFLNKSKIQIKIKYQKNYFLDLELQYLFTQWVDYAHANKIKDDWLKKLYNWNNYRQESVNFMDDLWKCDMLISIFDKFKTNYWRLYFYQYYLKVPKFHSFNFLYSDLNISMSEVNYLMEYDSDYQDVERMDDLNYLLFDYHKFDPNKYFL